MRQLEQHVFHKVNEDFLDDIMILETGLNAIIKCVQILLDKTPLLDKPNLRANLKDTDQGNRRSATHILLISHAVKFLQASRLLLLTGYIVPSLSCLRTAFESFQNAHICSVFDDQALRLLNGKELNKKLQIEYPIQLDKDVSKEIKRTLSSYGVHANYEAMETQAIYEGSIFTSENRATYEFIFLRNYYSFLTVSLLLMDYLINSYQFLVDEYPEAANVAKEIASRTVGTAKKIQILSLNP